MARSPPGVWRAGESLDCAMPCFVSTNMRLQAKTALITGGASGIGRATALLFAREGATIGIADLNKTGGNSLVEEIRSSGGRALFTPVDVSRAADCHRMVEHTVHEFGTIHILFNNAGIIRRATVTELSEEDWDG